ncbi:MAG: HigA family addiction module antitoxin [Cyclobacteriaceae bacterium]
MKRFIQHNPPHPGEILYELYFEPLKLSVSEAAEKLLITRPNLSTIINGRAGISTQMALKLAKAFDTTPQYWMSLQNNYDLWKAGQENEFLDKVKVLV